MPISPLEKYLNEFSAEYSALAKKVVAEISRRLDGVTNPQYAAAIIQDVFKKYGFEKSTFDSFFNFVIQSVKVGAGLKTIAQPVALKKWFLENAYTADGVKFSSYVNDIIRVPEIVETVRKSIQIGEAWKMAAQRLSDTGIQQGNVAQAIEDLRTRARQAFSLADDPQAYRSYVQEINRAQARADALIDPSHSKLRRAYQDVIDATKTGSQEAVDGALKYAVYFKQRSETECIVSTEMSRAYGQAFYTDALNDPDAAYMRWELNSGHDHYDICNFNSEANLYGLGAGCYPFNSVPPYPAHPNCMCVLSSVYSTSGRVLADMNNKKAESYIKQLPAQQKRDLMGKAGAQAFNDNPATWKDQVNNYEAHGQARTTIPAELLYGKK